ncbi:MAG TPA: WecB/TagA/CpsF family glycosyltransferase [Candidatus Limnocylindrales bacterium]|nr:WecB/TagA/CpsF family glycosyltransferase [Candidatus Limnocylindrales bacterium]
MNTAPPHPANLTTVRVDVLDVPTDGQRFDAAVECLLVWAGDAAGRRYVCTCPVYTLMMGRERPDVMAALRGADMVAADGMPVVWLQKKLGAPFAERVYGPDVLLALAEQSVDAGLRHVFYGGLPGVPEALAAALTQRFPGLKIAGAYSPPVAPVGPAPDEEAIARLNEMDADIVWVGLGSPKQDLWMALHRPHLHAPLLIGVGAAFDMIAGAKRQAPRWMQRSGLEWLYRLAQEPGRLGKRYLIYNPRFLWLALRRYGL